MSRVTDAIAITQARHRILDVFTCSCGWTSIGVEAHLTDEINKAIEAATDAKPPPNRPPTEFDTVLRSRPR